MDYTTVSFIVLVFIIQLVILWYIWWVYKTLNSDIQDTQDLLVEIYTLQLTESKKGGLDIGSHLPKRIQKRIQKN